MCWVCHCLNKLLKTFYKQHLVNSQLHKNGTGYSKWHAIKSNNFKENNKIILHFAGPYGIGYSNLYTIESNNFKENYKIILHFAGPYGIGYSNLYTIESNNFKENNKLILHFAGPYSIGYSKLHTIESNNFKENNKLILHFAGPYGIGYSNLSMNLDRSKQPFIEWWRMQEIVEGSILVPDRSKPPHFEDHLTVITFNDRKAPAGFSVITGYG